MKNIIWVGLLVVVVIIGGFVLGRPHAESTGSIKIGLILPLTGDLAFIGEAGRDAANLALAEVNADPSLKHTYTLVIEDDAFNPAKTAGAINKLISVDHVNAVISVGSGGGNVVAPIAEENKLPHIGLASDAVVAKGDYNFTNWTRPQEEVDLMLTELKRRNLTKVAVLGVKQSGFQAIDQDFGAKAAAAGVTVVNDQEFASGTTDFKTMLGQAQATHPDVYLLNAFSPELEILGKQAKDLGITTPMTSIESFGLSNNPKIFEGQWFIDSAVTIGGFGDKFRAAYDKAPGPTAGNIYDAIHLMVNAVEATGKDSPTGAEIVAQLGKVNNYSGAFGPLTVTPDGQFVSQPSVKVIKDGKPVPYTN
mgnify:CR=1 FL=1